MVIGAIASNSGSGQVVAKSNVDFGVANNINLGGVRITASALNAGGSGVTALARFVETNANVHLNIGAGGLDVEALASSLGGGGASANALVDIVQNNLVVLGDITVAATASNGPGGERRCPCRRQSAPERRRGRRGRRRTYRGLRGGER